MRAERKQSRRARVGTGEGRGARARIAHGSARDDTARLRAHPLRCADRSVGQRCTPSGCAVGEGRADQSFMRLGARHRARCTRYRAHASHVSASMYEANSNAQGSLNAEALLTCSTDTGTRCAFLIRRRDAGARTRIDGDVHRVDDSRGLMLDIDVRRYAAPGNPRRWACTIGLRLASTAGTIQ